MSPHSPTLAAPSLPHLSPPALASSDGSEGSRAGGDVYRIESGDLRGPWEVANVLQPTVYENDKGARVQSGARHG